MVASSVPRLLITLLDKTQPQHIGTHAHTHPSTLVHALNLITHAHTHLSTGSCVYMARSPTRRADTRRPEVVARGTEGLNASTSTLEEIVALLLLLLFPGTSTRMAISNCSAAGPSR